MNQEPRFFSDIPEGAPRPKTGVRLPDDTFAQATLSLPKVCVDIVIINRHRRCFYLPKRIVKPFQGCWWMVGGRLFSFETAREAASRIFFKDTTVRVPENRFKYLEGREYMLKDREEFPQDAGTHSVVHQYAVELDAVDELPQAMKYMSPEEYDTMAGLREFSRDDIAGNAECPRPLLEIYNLVFPKSAFYRFLEMVGIH